MINELSDCFCKNRGQHSKPDENFVACLCSSFLKRKKKKNLHTAAVA